MCKIFYCGGSAGRLGMLRAVIPLADLAHTLSQADANYAGGAFPQMERESSSCTVIEVSREEEGGQWKAGFYRVEKSPLDFEDYLRALRKTTSEAI